jgi:hypothetical protein
MQQIGDEVQPHGRSNGMRVLRSAMLYVALVGLPFAGLFIIMQQGKALVPPPSVGGEWTLSPDLDQLSCLGLDTTNTMTIEQSGRFLRVHVGGVVTEGRIHDELLSARLQAPSGSCVGQDASLEATAVDERLVITVQAPSCDACADVTFDAHRPSSHTL